MAKVIVVLCDVKPCTYQAEREFELNGETLYVCGEQCYARYWSREYSNWKESRYGIQITFDHVAPKQEETQEVCKNSSELFKSNLQIVKPRYG